MNLSTSIAAMLVLGSGLFLLSNYNVKVAVTPDAPAVQPDVAPPAPVAKAVSKLRDLTTNETLKIYAENVDAIDAWVVANYAESDHSIRELVQLWLLENPKLDPRVSKYPALVKTCKAMAGGNCDCTKCECSGDKQCTSGIAVGVVSPVKCKACDGTGYEPVVSKAAPLYTEPQPVAKPAAASEYMRVRVPYTVRSGFGGRRSYTAYREEWMLKSEYARRMAAQKAQPRMYYRGGCAGGNCR